MPRSRNNVAAKNKKKKVFKLAKGYFGRRKNVCGITDPKLNDYATQKFSELLNISFAGVEKVEALSDTRLAVYFKPAINRSSIKNADTDVVNAEFVYQVHKDGDEEAFTSYIDLNLRLNSEGYYVGEVEMDGRGDCASLSMSAKRFTNPGQIVYSSKYLLGCAKSEYYPSFSGIFSASAPTGCSAYSGVNLTWKVAENSEELDAEISRYENLVAENLANYSNMTYAEFIANDTAYKAQIETLEEYEPASYKIYYSTNIII